MVFADTAFADVVFAHVVFADVVFADVVFADVVFADVVVADVAFAIGFAFHYMFLAVLTDANDVATICPGLCLLELD